MTIGLAALGLLSILLWSWPRSSDVVVDIAVTARSSAISDTDLAASIAMVILAAGVALKSPTIALLGPALVGAVGMNVRRRRARRVAADRAGNTVACLDRIITQLRAGASLSGSFTESVSDASMPRDHALGEVVDRLNLALRSG